VDGNGQSGNNMRTLFMGLGILVPKVLGYGLDDRGSIIKKC
jgi:hypothetical protein